jgi:hypothetical protein
MAIDNSKLVLELFNFRKELKHDGDDNIERQITNHLELFRCDETGKIQSQKNIVNSLSENLKAYTYDDEVKAFVESVNGIVQEDELFYELEDLYRKLENSNQGQVYSYPMQVVLDIINEGSEREKQVKILNELALYDWIPAVKNFLFKYTTDPTQRQNLSSDGGKAEPVISIVEKVQNDKNVGFLTYIGDKWFFLSEDVEVNSPDQYTDEQEVLHRLSTLEKAINISNIENGKIIFRIDEDLDLAISLDNGSLELNGEELDKDATLESVFDSPLVPFMRRDLYPVISETIKNLDKFVDLDVVQRITNITNPFLEAFAFNYNNKMYVYSLDKRYGNHLHEYNSAMLLVNEMRTSLGYDLSAFFKDHFSDEVNAKRELEDREKFVISKLSELNENIEKLEVSGLVEVNEQIKVALEALKEEKEKAELDLEGIKGALSNEKYLK